MSRALVLLLVVCCAAPLPAEEQRIFSGPQAGEPLPPLPVRTVTVRDGQLRAADEPQDWTEQAGDKQLLLIFVHKLTRPSLGLARALIDYAATLRGVESGIVFLDDDTTERLQWMRRAQHALPKNAKLGLSADGAEGPGAYGLNRNVTLTVLVGGQGRVAANFALVQPSVQADAVEIAAQVAKAAGVDPPAAEQLLGPRQRMQEVDIRPLLAPVLDKQATPEQVAAAAGKVERRAARQPAFKRAVGLAAGRVVGSGKLESYGTPAAQRYLKKWAAWAAAAKQPPRRPERGPD